MATRGRSIPTKLKHDAIVEAVFEVRFDTSTLPEVLFGRFADHGPWKSFSQRRMPVHEIPAMLREVEPNLRYQPEFELANADAHRAVRIGQHVISYHQTAPYVGWGKLQPELTDVVEALFAKTEASTITRLGLRYINAIQADLHGIHRISDLDLTVAVAHEVIDSSVNINFNSVLSKDTQCTVRVATTDLVQGVLPPTTSVLIDVDVFTPSSFTTNSSAAVKSWVDFAHTREKEQFFRLLRDEAIEALREE